MFKRKSTKQSRDYDEQYRDIEAKTKQLLTDLEFWHRTFRKFSVIPCAYCGKHMRIYPYGGAYYHIKDNRKVHAACYDTYLAERKPNETAMI